jgi:NAD+ kinase
VGFFKNIGVFCKQKPTISHEVLAELAAWLRKNGGKVFMDVETAGIIGETSSYEKADIPGISELIIVLGGDGTLLSVAQLTHKFNVPVLAINLGSLGFLTEVSLPELYETLGLVMQNKFSIDERMLLNACLWRGKDKVQEYNVLNDVVINKGVLARIVNLDVSVNDQHMTSYRADGLIIATPTGSTAYSLSAGGPIIHPSMRAFVLSPICPFSLTNRSIVVPDNSRIQVRLTTESEDVRITLDGQMGCAMHMGDVLEVKKAQTTIKLIQTPGKNYYQILRQKLHWGRPAHDPITGKE